MDFLLPLTIIGFIISFYSISEEYKKRNLLFKFSWFDKLILLVFFIALIVTIFIQNFYLIQNPEPVYYSFNCNGADECYKLTYSFLLSICAFLIASVIVIYFIVKLNSKQLFQRKRFIKNSLDNLNKHKYAELSADLELFHNELLRKYKKPKHEHFFLLKYMGYWLIEKLGLQNEKSLKDKLNKDKIMSFLEFKNKEKTEYERFGYLLNHFKSKKPTWKTKIKIFFSKLRIIRNNKMKYCNLIDNFYNELANDTCYIEYLIENNLNTALERLQAQTTFNKEKLWDKIGRYSIKNTNSKLYTELNESYSGNRELIGFLFSDTSKCAEFLAWKPIGDFVIEYIENQKKKKTDENNHQENNYELVKNNSPIYIGIRFFGIMVNKALEQNIGNHMWLYYLGYWTEKIINNLEYTNDSSAEFKNMYEYYLYQIFDTYRDWIKYVIRNAYTIRKGTGHANIIESAIDSFTFAMKDIAKSENVRDEFKSYLREMYLNAYMELATSSHRERLNQYQDYFDDCLSGKGEHVPTKPQFIRFLQDAVNNPMRRELWDRGAEWHMQSSNRPKLIQFQQLLNSLTNHSRSR